MVPSSSSAGAITVTPLPSTVVNSAPQASGGVLLDPALKQQMIVSFSEQSGMNTDWSLK